ncbi:thermonuclease family protein [Sphingobium indicum]|nr:thermonuclease family protein [Sphingobium indicum]
MPSCRDAILVPDDPGSEAEAIEVKVDKVVDGDGFMAKAWNGLSRKWIAQIPFRFAFIDAPELDQPCGPQSRAFLNHLIGGQGLKIFLIGKESTGFLPLDTYKRVLCMGFLTDHLQPGEISYYRNGACSSGRVRRARPIIRNIELEMVVNGWAWVVESYAFEREDEYFAAQDDARRDRRGLWALTDPEPPRLFKRRQRRLRTSEARQLRLL